MKKPSPTSVVEQYEQKHQLYSHLTEMMASLIRELLSEKDFSVHSINSRVKDHESLRKKIETAEGKYADISEVTDLSGIRIITYFEDDVDKVAEVIEGEFDIDKGNSVDKRDLLDPDRFGYLSLHYICGLPATRLRLTEYQRFKGCRFEIQIRSILQHAWAEIEHDLGYKSKLAVPKEVRRRFSRLAGLLEIADSEFGKLRDNLQEYEAGVAEQIENVPESVSIDIISLKSFIEGSATVRRLDGLIASYTNRVLDEDRHAINHIVSVLYAAGLRSIRDIEMMLEKYEGGMESFVEAVVSAHRMAGQAFVNSMIVTGISLVYLSHIVVASSQSYDGVLAYMDANFPPAGRDMRWVSNMILESYNQVFNSRDKNAGKKSRASRKKSKA